MESIWSKTCKLEQRSALRGQIQTEAVVIGAGMAGILTAYQLERAGIRTVVLEAGRIGGGQTKNTTAKITSQHGLFCHKFIEKKGKTIAGMYVRANQSAVEEYKRLIQEEKIECDFEETSSYVYSKDERKLKEEAEAAEELGVLASYAKHIEIPVDCAGAVRFEHQAQFHPLKFISALADKLTVYENTRVQKAENNMVITDSGTVKADKIIFATHYPFVNFPGMYFLRMHQQRSYVLAVENGQKLEGMYIGDGPDSLSFRQYGQYTLIGGGSHRTGDNKAGGKYAALRRAANGFYPQNREAACWSAQDCITGDSIPFIGRYSSSRPNWFVASGFKKWGMTSSMVSAMILRDIICGAENSYANVFSPARFSAEELLQIIKDGGKSVSGLAKRFFHIPRDTVNTLRPDHGSVVRADGKKAGVYKSWENKVYKVDNVCSHLGCQLEWNPDEKTWDCPCHGSCFDHNGKLKEGPAQQEIS